MLFCSFNAECRGLWRELCCCWCEDWVKLLMEIEHWVTEYASGMNSSIMSQKFDKTKHKFPPNFKWLSRLQFAHIVAFNLTKWTRLANLIRLPVAAQNQQTSNTHFLARTFSSFSVSSFSSFQCQEREPFLSIDVWWDHRLKALTAMTRR